MKNQQRGYFDTWKLLGLEPQEKQQEIINRLAPPTEKSGGLAAKISKHYGKGTIFGFPDGIQQERSHAGV